MNKLPQDFTMRSATVDDAQITVDLIIACDIAQYGGPDSDLDELLYENVGMKCVRRYDEYHKALHIEAD